MGMSERCLHNEVCKYGDCRSNGMYCTEGKCKQFKNRTNYVEVVRCKDCKNGYTIDGTGALDCCLHGMYVEPDDFCSYGERKDNDST